MKGMVMGDLQLSLYLVVDSIGQPGTVQGLSASVFLRSIACCICASDSCRLFKIFFVLSVFLLDPDAPLWSLLDCGWSQPEVLLTTSCTGRLRGGLAAVNSSKIYRINHCGIVNGPAWMRRKTWRLTQLVTLILVYSIVGSGVWYSAWGWYSLAGGFNTKSKGHIVPCSV